MVVQTFLSPQVKQSVIITNKIKCTSSKTTENLGSLEN